MIEVKVKCQGRLHAVRLTDKGRLALPAHPGGTDASDEVMDKVGLKSGCRRVLKDWQYVLDGAKIPSVLPKLLAEAAMNAIARQRRFVSLSDGANLLERTRVKTEEALRRLIMTEPYETWSKGYICRGGAQLRVYASFTRYHSDWERGSPIMDAVVNHDMCRTGFGGMYPLVTIWVPLLWHAVLYQNQLAVLDRRIVLDCSREGDSVTILGQSPRSYMFRAAEIVPPEWWTSRFLAVRKDLSWARAGTSEMSQKWRSRLLKPRWPMMTSV